MKIHELALLYIQAFTSINKNNNIVKRYDILIKTQLTSHAHTHLLILLSCEHIVHLPVRGFVVGKECVTIIEYWKLAMEAIKNKEFVSKCNTNVRKKEDCGTKHKSIINSPPLQRISQYHPRCLALLDGKR